MLYKVKNCFFLIILMNFLFHWARHLVRVGDTDLGSAFDDSKAIKVPVDIIAVYRHPRYLRGQAYYNVAILRLKTPVNFSDHVLPICLPETASPDPDMYSGKLVTLTGWGPESRRVLGDNNYLQRVHMGVFSQRHAYHCSKALNRQLV